MLNPDERTEIRMLAARIATASETQDQLTALYDDDPVDVQGDPLITGSSKSIVAARRRINEIRYHAFRRAFGLPPKDFNARRVGEAMMVTVLVALLLFYAYLFLPLDSWLSWLD